MSDPVTRLNAALEGRYAIERELGECGMATVYLAEDIKHELPLFDSGVEALKLPCEPPNQVERKLGVLGRLGRIHARAGESRDVL